MEKFLEDNIITALLIKPGQSPTVIEIENTLEAKQEAVGGYIQAIYPFEDEVAIICNEEGKINGMPFNRALYITKDMYVPDMKVGDIYDIIAGDFLVVGLTPDNFGSLDDKLLAKYEKCFHNPEIFVKRDKEIIALPGRKIDHSKWLTAANGTIYKGGFEFDLHHNDLIIESDIKFEGSWIDMWYGDVYDPQKHIVDSIQFYPNGRGYRGNIRDEHGKYIGDFMFQDSIELENILRVKFTDNRASLDSEAFDAREASKEMKNDTLNSKQIDKDI